MHIFQRVSVSIHIHSFIQSFIRPVQYLRSMGLHYSMPTVANQHVVTEH